MKKEFKIALKNQEIIDPLSIDSYLSLDGYKSLKSALAKSSSDIIAEILSSGLRGRGGAGFLAGIKEKSTMESNCFFRDKKCLHYIVCNADEGEPGTFKDRIIMENNPHLLIEGLIIAAYAVKATIGYIYIRGEYFNAITLVKKAVQQAYIKGFIGNNILESDFSLDLEVKIGAGSYLCGEELTLLESIEGNRGYPRIKPPYPSDVGLFSMPTLINNVETLSHIPSIIAKGPKWYRSIGTKNSPGTKIFTISGDVVNPGCFEVEMGISLKTILYKFSGGIKKGNKFKAALVGGAAGMFIPEAFINIPMDFDSLKKEGFTLGSGAIIVLSDYRSVFDVLASVLNFFTEESCGKCIPCRVGTKQLSIMINKLLNKNNSINFINKILDSMIYNSNLMAKTSLCPLGQSPEMPIKSAIKYFRDDLLNY